MSDDTKFYGFMLLVFIIGIFFTSISEYFEYIETKNAIDQGYEQVVENDKIVWKKSKE